MLDADGEKKIDEEAIAEEEFVADLEDTIENPLVFDGDKITVENKKNGSTSKPEREELPGAVGSGDLIPEEKPFNNEEALRSENVNNDQNPFSPDSPSEKGFGGPNVAPLEDAAETIAPAAAAEAETVADAPAANPFAGPATEEPDATQGDNNTNSTENSTNAGVFASTEPAATTAATSSTAESTPTVQDLANGANKPKKKKTGLIIGIVLAILLLGLIGGGIAFYLIHESKERAISDSIVNLIEANARQFDGTYTQTNLSDEDDSFESFTLTFKGDNNSANFSGSGSLHIDLKEGKDIELEVSGAYISNDAIYVKINGIKKAIDDAMKEGMSSSGGGLSSDEEAAFIMNIIGSIVKPLDDQWIKIDASSLKPYASLKSGYDCMSNAIDGFAKEENKEKIVEAYKNHPFVMDADKDSKSSDGLNYYYIKSDSEESKAFSEEIGKIDFVKDFKSCANIKLSEDDDDDDESDLTSELSIGISPWAHELKHVKGTAKSKEYSAEMNIKISYDDKSVTAPTGDAKTLDDLAKDLSKSIKDALSEQIATMCKEYKTYGESAYNYCVEQYTKELDEEFNFENLINSGQGMIKTSI